MRAYSADCFGQISCEAPKADVAQPVDPTDDFTQVYERLRRTYQSLAEPAVRAAAERIIGSEWLGHEVMNLM